MRCLPRVEGLGKRRWTRDRFDEALRKVGLSDTRPLKRAMNVKPNEALGKLKSLLILSTGNVGCVTHLFDAGVVETFIFSSRSVRSSMPLQRSWPPESAGI